MIRLDHLQKAGELYQSNGVLTRDEIISTLNVSDKTARVIREIIINSEVVGNYFDGATDDKSIHTETTDTEQYIITRSSEIKTLDDLLTYCKVNTEKWEVSKHVVGSWGSSTNECFQVKAWLKKKESEFDIDKILERFREEAEHHAPEYKPIEHAKQSENMLELNIPDLHFGSLVWQKETRDFNYDIKVARKLYLNCVDYLLSHSMSHRPEKILFLVGSDFLNSDNLINTTTAGTLQTEDCRWQKTYSEAWKLIVDAIDKCRQVAPVEAVVVEGNHDRQRSFYLGETISAWYSKCNDVSINNEPTPRKYIEYGANLIGLTHGVEKKIDELPLIMAQEAKEEWGRTEFRTWHIGHKHFRKKMIFTPIDERQAVRIEQISSLASTDDWHSRSGYNSIKEASAFVWDKYKGQVACYNFHPTEEDYK